MTRPMPLASVRAETPESTIRPETKQEIAIISMAIFLIGIPALRYFLPAAILLGGAVALIIHFIRHETPGKAWILRP